MCENITQINLPLFRNFPLNFVFNFNFPDAGSAVAAKINSAAMRTTKDKERKVSNTSSQRKK